MRSLLALPVLAFVAVTAYAGTDSGFDPRCARLLDVASAETETSFFSLAAKLRVRRDLPRAYAILDSMSRDISMGGMFYAYTLIGTYLHARPLIPDSLHRKVREAFRVRTMYRGDTENHWVMYYTGMYLAAQTWPGGKTDQPGSTDEVPQRTSRKLRAGSISGSRPRPPSAKGSSIRRHT